MRAVLDRCMKGMIRRAWRSTPIVGADGYDLGELMKLRAAMDSADYCAEHMPRASAFASGYDLLSFALAQVSVQGDHLEFGVASGKTINHIAKQVPQTVHGFDTFKGLPEDWHTGYPKGAFAQAVPVVRGNVQLHIGLFTETLPRFTEASRNPVAFLHVDCDLYSSTCEIFEHLGKRILSGTVIVFDEYFNHPTWRYDEWRAFQEFVAASDFSYNYLGYVPSHQQVCVVMRDKKSDVR